MPKSRQDDVRILKPVDDLQKNAGRQGQYGVRSNHGHARGQQRRQDEAEEPGRENDGDQADEKGIGHGSLGFALHAIVPLKIGQAVEHPGHVADVFAHLDHADIDG